MAEARGVLGSVFGFEAFRPGQAAVIEALLGGRNVLTVMHTGSGKSLCFQVPAYIVFPDRTLIDMARRRPRNEAEFAQVNGVGAVKLEQFAGPFLAAIDAVPSKGGAGANAQADAS